eukprot:m.5259 g.5259  ORF g.5259 m.5259 type:complete len:70 (+) comp12629_c0_seq1:115-324(+)
MCGLSYFELAKDILKSSNFDGFRQIEKVKKICGKFEAINIKKSEWLQSLDQATVRGKFMQYNSDFLQFF